MKSMKKIADELNVTKMTVYNNAKKANVKFQKIDNVRLLMLKVKQMEKIMIIMIQSKMKQ